MANMDYPGPCYGCEVVAGCSTADAREKAVKQYCKGVELELDAWKVRLYDVLASAADLKGADSEKLQDTIDLVKSTVRELEQVKEQLEQECPVDISGQEKTIGDGLDRLRTGYTEAMKVLSPGFFGG
jgi:hypothetical protein